MRVSEALHRYAESLVMEARDIDIQPGEAVQATVFVGGCTHGGNFQCVGGNSHFEAAAASDFADDEETSPTELPTTQSVPEGYRSLLVPFGAAVKLTYFVQPDDAWSA